MLESYMSRKILYLTKSSNNINHPNLSSLNTLSHRNTRKKQQFRGTSCFNLFKFKRLKIVVQRIYTFIFWLYQCLT